MAGGGVEGNGEVARHVGNSALKHESSKEGLRNNALRGCQGGSRVTLRTMRSSHYYKVYTNGGGEPTNGGERHGQMFQE